jgi:hypothetical protein
MPVVLAVTREGGTVQRIEAPADVWLKGARRWVARVAVAPRIVSVEIDPDEAFPDIDRDNQRWKR